MLLGFYVFKDTWFYNEPTYCYQNQSSVSRGLPRGASLMVIKNELIYFKQANIVPSSIAAHEI